MGTHEDPKPTASSNNRFFLYLNSAMDSISYFLHSGKKLAANLGCSFDHSSRPARIDKSELSRLKLKLAGIRAALKRADGVGLSGELDRLWMRELRELEYMAEDVVEIIQFEALRVTRFQEFKNELVLTSAGKRNRETCALFSPVQSDSLMMKIKKIEDRFEEISKQRENLKLEGGEHKPASLNETSSFTACKLYGRDDDMKKVIEWLKSDDGSESAYSVKTVVGMAGVGKSTLLQHVYNDRTIQSSFDLKTWVYVSQQYNVLEILRKFVEAIEGTSPNCSDLTSLHSTVVKHLTAKRFLIVLDDMWDEDPAHWQSLQVPLTCGRKGSKVLVTTRSMKVCQIVGSKRYHLRCLSDDSSWLVCWNRACHGREMKLDGNMVAIGKKIVSRCRGLPLAAAAIGVSLSSRHEEKYWNNVLENLLLIEDCEVNKILPALRVSYDYLPLHLKRCFAYCSLFPKGYVFQKDTLVHLWMAQGFIDSNWSSNLELAGRGYFDNLLERCFFQNSPSHYPTEERYVMHDLYHELAQDVSGKEFHRNEDHKIQNLGEDVRHSSIVRPEPHPEKVMQLGSFGGQSLRSFLFVGENKPEGVPFCMNISRDLFVLLDCLRALDLSNTGIESLPINIGNLIHLRYLSCENSKIRCLPESVSGLFNLQTLNLRECNNLNELPKGMKLLDNLRHLYLPLSRACTILMPYGMGNMTSLQTLSLFVVGTKTEGCRIEELGNLVNLKGEMHVSDIKNVDDLKSVEEANMQNKVKIEKLTLEWSAANSNSPDLNEELAPEILEKLKPHHNLEVLTINGFCGIRFPSWLSDQYLQKLAILDLKGCNKVEKLPSLGQLPSLKHLTIHSMAALTLVGKEFCGFESSSSSSSSSVGQCSRGFPKLESLVFKKMGAWEVWVGVDSGDFPCLRYLSLYECNMLKKRPQFPVSVKVKDKRYPLFKEQPEDVIQCQGVHTINLHVETTNNTSQNCLRDCDIVMSESNAFNI